MEFGGVASFAKRRTIADARLSGSRDKPARFRVSGATGGNRHSEDMLGRFLECLAGALRMLRLDSSLPPPWSNPGCAWVADSAVSATNLPI